MDSVEKIDTLYLGDSYFELYNSRDFAGNGLFSDCFPDDHINIGIGGTKFCEWIPWAEKLKGTPEPKNIVINLGFNDIHFGFSAKKSCSDGMKLVNALREYFPNSKYFIISAIHCPGCTKFFDEEKKYNALLLKNAEKNNITVGDWNGKIAASGKDCFHPDLIHPNEYGYKLFGEFLKELTK